MAGVAVALGDTLSRVPVDGCRLIAGEPVGDAWFDLAAIDEALVLTWLDAQRAGEARGRADVAGANLAAYLGGVVAEPVAAAVLTLGRGWPAHPTQLAAHRHPDGWFDALAVRGGPVWVLPDDPLRDQPGVTVVADPGALRTEVAGGLVDLLHQIFTMIRAQTRLGWPAMWGALGDVIACAAVDRAREGGTDATAAWRDAHLLLDAIALRAPQIRTRRTLASVAWSGGTARFGVRGTCCLYYKVSGEPPDRDGEAFCTRCPLRDAADRCRRWTASLDADRRAGVNTANPA